MAEKQFSLEDDVFGEETSAVRTKRVFDESAPFAAAQIVDLAHNAPNDNTRLRAAQYIVDRVLGPLGKEEQQDALDEFLKGMESLANKEL